MQRKFPLHSPGGPANHAVPQGSVPESYVLHQIQTASNSAVFATTFNNVFKRFLN